MTRAELLALGAGALAAGATTDVAVLLADRARRRRARPTPAGRWGAAAARLGRRLGVPSAPSGLADRVAAAGLPARVQLADVMAAKVGVAAAGLLLAGTLAVSLPPRQALTMLAVGAAGGFFAPDVWLARRARARLARAGLELADVVDLLRVAVEAGLPPTRALAEVGRRHAGLVAGELRAAAGRVELGAGVAESLELLRARLPLPEMAVLVAALQRAARHGAPPGPALAALAADARAERARRMRDHAAAAAPRIQLAIALLLVPSVLLVVAAGLVRALAGGA